MRSFFKKKIVIIALVLVGIGATAWAAKVGPFSEKEQTMEEFLFESGFKVIPDLTGSELGNYWKSRYNLRFLSDADMDTLCKANGFIVAPSRNYLDMIPDHAAREMKANYEKIEGDMLSYDFFTYTYEGTFIREPRIGGKLFSLSGTEVKSWIRGKERWRGSVVRETWFDREQRITKAVRPEIIKRYMLNVEGYGYNWIMVRNKDAENIKIVAHHSRFDTSGFNVDSEVLVIPPKKDPLAVIKHRGGWVILAHWL
jgi:hypothetical protein